MITNSQKTHIKARSYFHFNFTANTGIFSAHAKPIVSHNHYMPRRHTAAPIFSNKPSSLRAEPKVVMMSQKQANENNHPDDQMKMSMDTASMIDNNNKYTRQQKPLEGLSDFKGTLNLTDSWMASDIEQPIPTAYTQMIRKAGGVPVYSIEQHINDKLYQYAPLMKGQTNAKMDSVKEGILNSGVDFQVDHKDQIIKLIEKFQDNEQVFKDKGRTFNTLVVGLNHQTALVEVREKFSMTDEVMERISKDMRKSPLVKEVAILNTCNRLEIYIISDKIDETVDVITDQLRTYSKLSADELQKHLFMYSNEQCVNHLMRTSGGLESLVLGEGQILSQVKDTFAKSKKHGGAGKVMNYLFSQAIKAGKRVRNETKISTGAVSISSAAVELAQTKCSNISDAKVAIIGAGKMSRLLIQHLTSKGVKDITICNRDEKRAVDLIHQCDTLISNFDAQTITIKPFSALMDVVKESDITFTSTGAQEPIIRDDNIQTNQDHKNILIDISVPRNIYLKEPISGVSTFDVDDLQEVVNKNNEARMMFAKQAESILYEEQVMFENWLDSLQVVPTIISMQKQAENIRKQEADKVISNLEEKLTDKEIQLIERMSKLIVKKMLHNPMTQLRKASTDDNNRDKTNEAAKYLFNLEDEQDQGLI